MSDLTFPHFSRRITQAYIALTSTFMLLSTPANAATEDGMFAARGFGAQQCSVLTQAVDGTEAEAVRDRLTVWISGYLSHANRATVGAFDVMPIQDHTALAEITINICRSNPGALAETVVYSLLDKISSGMSGVSSDLIIVKEGNRETSVRSDVMRQVQLALVARNLLESKNADGLPGPNTRAALEKFQSGAGLTITGLPDPATLFTLFTEN